MNDRDPSSGTQQATRRDFLGRQPGPKHTGCTWGFAFYQTNLGVLEKLLFGTEVPTLTLLLNILS